MMNLHACNRPHELHFELLTLFVQFLDKSQIKPIQESFMQMDEDNGGTIEIDELETSYKAMRELAIGIE
jgi:Ca2+-binding EF-hand superfamily protein